MPRKPSQKPDKASKEEYKRFLETAREVGASDQKKVFDKAFKKIASPKQNSN